MKSIQQNLSVVLLVALSAVSFLSEASAWGPEGHQIVAHVGSSVAEVPFFAANADTMRRLSTVPDRKWKDPRTKSDEESTHWFQADAYVTDIRACEDLLDFPRAYRDAVAKYGASKVLKNGSAPWRVIQMFNLALSALKAGNLEGAVEAAGVMTHYVGDIAMPLHVSENYDGQKTGNRGIHAFFETQIIDREFEIREDVSRRAVKLLADRQFIEESKGELADVLNHQIIRSLLKRDELLRNDTKNGRKTKTAIATQLELAKDRMADGAATLAILLSRLSQEAALGSANEQVSVQDPKWIAPNYY